MFCAQVGIWSVFGVREAVESVNSTVSGDL